MIFVWLKRLIWFGLFICSICCAAGCLFYYHTSKSLPDVETLKNVTMETPLRIYTSDNYLIAEFAEQRRIPLKIEEIPTQLKNAFLAIEDSRFYDHFGIDPIGITRAAYVSFIKGSKAQGASTITQQVARNFYLSNEKTYTRKIKEIFLAWNIEQTLSKDEILELYLNKIALGHHAYGVAAAAYIYFGKDVNELTLGEMAIIAGLPKAPSNLNPISHPKRAKERRHLVLNRMLELGMITKDEYNIADNEPIIAKYHTANIEVSAPYVAESIRQKLESTYGERIYTDGFKAYATITSKDQIAANKAVYHGIIDYDIRHGFHKPENLNNIDLNNTEQLNKILSKKTSFEFMTPAIVINLDTNKNSANVFVKNKGLVNIEWNQIKWARPFKNDSYQGAYPKKVTQVLKPSDLIYVELLENGKYALRQIPQVQAALISLDPNNGNILAMCGGFSFKQSHFNRVEQAKRQAGSNFKPFLYSAALANGYSLATLMLDDRISIWNAGSKQNWSPKNSPNVYEGYIPLRQALAKSKNVVSVRLVRALGVDNFVTHLNKFGFTVGRYQRNDSLALGAFEVTPLELVTAYATFANGGFKIEPNIISKVTVGEGTGEEILYESNPPKACPECPDAINNTIEPLPIPEIAQKNKENNIAPQIISHSNSFLMANTLKSVIFGGEGPNGKYWGTGSRASSLKRTDIAGKTGTTNQSRDAWFSGFNADVVTTVWMGFDNFTRPLGRSESGGKSSLPIWINYMKEVLKDKPLNPVKPSNDIYQSIIAGYPEYYIKDQPIMIHSPYIEESDFNLDPADKSEDIDDLF